MQRKVVFLRLNAQLPLVGVAIFPILPNNMKNFFVFFAAFTLFAATLLLSGCTEETEDITLEYGYAYFPIDSGHWIIYAVDSVIYSTFLSGGVDTVSLQIKEVFTNPFTDNEGRPAITIERYARYADTIAWDKLIPTVWYAAKNNQKAERKEGELRYLNMVFPALQGTKWMGNAYINTNQDATAVFANWQYTYTEVDVPKTMGTLSFSQTATIVQNDYEDLVNKIYSREVYAKNVGMIEKERWLLQLGTNDITSPLPWPQRAQRGTLVKMRVIDYKQ
ncbi:MAG TPA: hypothetical protein PK239_09450 [Chitinophagales bacterium]|nr:hypothetical protein [Chitinophagales bacterium]